MTKATSTSEATITAAASPSSEEVIEQNHELTESIQHLTKIIRHRTSRKYRFLVGIMTGVGTVIGATILAWSIIYILSLMVAQIDFSEMPIIEWLIEKAQLSTQP